MEGDIEIFNNNKINDGNEKPRYDSGLLNFIKILKKVLIIDFCILILARLLLMLMGPIAGLFWFIMSYGSAFLAGLLVLLLIISSRENRRDFMNKHFLVRPFFLLIALLPVVIVAIFAFLIVFMISGSTVQ
jgi:hypothetical protein